MHKFPLVCAIPVSLLLLLSVLYLHAVFLLLCAIAALVALAAVCFLRCLLCLLSDSAAVSVWFYCGERFRARVLDHRSAVLGF